MHGLGHSRARCNPVQVAPSVHSASAALSSLQDSALPRPHHHLHLHFLIPLFLLCSSIGAPPKAHRFPSISHNEPHVSFSWFYLLTYSLVSTSAFHPASRGRSVFIPTQSASPVASAATPVLISLWSVIASDLIPPFTPPPPLLHTIT